MHFAFSATPRSLAQVAAQLSALGHPVRGPVEHEGGDRSVYVKDPEGNLVEVWDFFERRPGDEPHVRALASGASQDDADRRGADGRQAVVR